VKRGRISAEKGIGRDGPPRSKILTYAGAIEPFLTQGLAPRVQIPTGAVIMNSEGRGDSVTSLLALEFGGVIEDGGSVRLRVVAIWGK
jgi:hypothetical protein